MMAFPQEFEIGPQRGQHTPKVQECGFNYATC